MSSVRSDPIIQKSPADKTPCHPILLLGLSEYVLEDLRHIFIHDIVFSTRATFGVNHHWDSGTCLHMLNYLDGKSLVSIARVFGGPVIVDEEDLFVSTDDYGCSVNMKTIDQLSQGDMQYQAIVTDDTNMINYPAIGNFVGKQYHNCDTSVVIMALEGIFDLSKIHEIFGVRWEVLAYTRRDIDLSDIGKSVIGEELFQKSYTKANFYSGPHELFVEVVNPEDFEDDYEDDAELEADTTPEPNPGSPIVTHFDGYKCLSYFGFVNSADINFGAVILRLCYASMNRA